MDAAVEQHPGWVLDFGTDQVIKDLCEEIDADPLVQTCDVTASVNDAGDCEIALYDKYGDCLSRWIIEGAFVLEREKTETGC